VTCWVVIPVKAPDACKTRLAGVLTEDERRALVSSMLQAVVAAAEAARGVDQVMLLGPSRHGLPERLRLLDDPGGGLGAALASALAQASAAGVVRLVILPGDLPKLIPSDVEALASLATREIGIAPDRAEAGTNALSLPLPQAADFSFRYGEASCALHFAEAQRLRLPVRLIRTSGLGLDIDAPGDLAALADPR